MEIRIEREGAAAGPVYQQIAAQIREAIDAGGLAEGDRLPPIRDLAGRVGVNRDTVALAYEALAAEGFVEARVGRGTFVRGRRPSGPLPGGGAEPAFSATACSTTSGRGSPTRARAIRFRFTPWSPTHACSPWTPSGAR